MEYERQSREERQQANTVYVPNTFGLSGPVGTSTSRRIMNADADQKLVIELLAGISAADGGKREEWRIRPLAGPAGTCSPILADAIWAFQSFWQKKGVFRNIDGVVDPGGNTIKKMTELLLLQPPVIDLVKMSALAEKDKDTSLRWAMSAVQSLGVARAFYEAKSGLIRPETQPRPLRIVLQALETHFHFSTLIGPQAAGIDFITSSYGRAINILLQSGSYFIDDTSSAEAEKGTPAHVPLGSGKVNFTPAFREYDPVTDEGFGPMCRAAMVLHEPFHITNHPAASTVQAHVHEGDTKYALNPAAQQLNNAHSYACFAQQCYFGSDTRFGIGRRVE